jgi:hypothetical protein
MGDARIQIKNFFDADLRGFAQILPRVFCVKGLEAEPLARGQT